VNFPSDFPTGVDGGLRFEAAERSPDTGSRAPGFGLEVEATDFLEHVLQFVADMLDCLRHWRDVNPRDHHPVANLHSGARA
jgi:hypothetical protein